MDPMFMAMSYFRKRKFEECVEICTKLLAKNPYDQVCFFQCFGLIKRVLLHFYMIYLQHA